LQIIEQRQSSLFFILSPHCFWTIFGQSVPEVRLLSVVTYPTLDTKSKYFALVAKHAAWKKRQTSHLSLSGEFVATLPVLPFVEDTS
jgi:hypothetical protein